MNARMRELLADVELVQPATDDSVEKLVRSLGHDLPGDYLELIRESNGGEGFVGEVSYLMLWPVEEVIERNRRLELPERMPGVVLFGSNGGDAGYGYDTTTRDPGSMPIVEVPYLDIGEPDAARVQGRTFIEFLERLAAEV